MLSSCWLAPVDHWLTLLITCRWYSCSHLEEINKILQLRYEKAVTNVDLDKRTRSCNMLWENMMNFKGCNLTWQRHETRGPTCPHSLAETSGTSFSDVSDDRSEICIMLSRSTKSCSSTGFFTGKSWAKFPSLDFCKVNEKLSQCQADWSRLSLFMFLAVNSWLTPLTTVASASWGKSKGISRIGDTEAK